jgi:hypothetical protein
LLAGWLVLDLRMQALLWQQHAASWSAFAGRTLDEKRAAERDAPIFSVARRIRDAERPRGGRVLVLSDSRRACHAHRLVPVPRQRVGRHAPLDGRAAALLPPEAFCAAATRSCWCSSTASHGTRRRAPRLARRSLARGARHPRRRTELALLEIR